MKTDKIILDYSDISINIQAATKLENILNTLDDNLEVIVDLTNAVYINSLGISTLIKAAKHKKSMLIKIKSSSAIEISFNILGLIGLKDVLNIEVVN